MQILQSYLGKIRYRRHKSPEVRQIVRGKSSGKSTEKKTPKTRAVIVELMKENPEVTISEIAAIVHTSTRNVEKHISNLQSKGIIRRIDGRKEGYWQVLI